jgi:hypothetical protein
VTGRPVALIDEDMLRRMLGLRPADQIPDLAAAVSAVVAADRIVQAGELAWLNLDQPPEGKP